MQQNMFPIAGYRERFLSKVVLRNQQAWPPLWALKPCRKPERWFLGEESEADSQVCQGEGMAPDTLMSGPLTGAEHLE